MKIGPVFPDDGDLDEVMRCGSVGVGESHCGTGLLTTVFML
jgi:hypothetical protein